MAHLIGRWGSQEGMRAWVGIAVGLALLAASTIEGAHEHTESETAAECFVCSLAHQGVPTPAVDAPVVDGPGIVHAPPLPAHRLIPRIVHLSPHRSRAPPLPISL